MNLLDSAAVRDTFEHELERVRRWYGCYVTGYVVMPEHVHLLLSEPERGTLSARDSDAEANHVTELAGRRTSRDSGRSATMVFRVWSEG